MNRINLIITILFTLLLGSCQKQELELNGEKDKKGEQEGFNAEGYVVEKGYLSFIDQNAVTNYIENINCILEKSSTDEALLKSAEISPVPEIPGFASLAGKMSDYKNRQLKSGSADNPEEDFLYELNNQLIPDEAIRYVVDTANQVKIAGKIYQISPFGTFIYSSADSLEYNELCENFIDKYENQTAQIDSITYLYGNITFVDSYGKLASLEEGEELEDKLFSELDGAYSADDNSESNTKSGEILKSASGRINSEYTNTYGLTTYKAGAKTIVGGFVQKVFGKNSWREKRLDSKHRIKVKLYDVNYGFYKNQGFRVEYNNLKDRTITVYYFKRWKLRKKKITLWSYWSSSRAAQEMVVGIDYFQGYTQYDSPMGRAYAENIPNVLVSKVSDYSIKMSYDGFIKTPAMVAKNWVTNLNIFKGVVFGYGDKIFTNKEISEKAFDVGMDFLRDEIKGSTRRLIKKQINKASSTPIAVFTTDYKGGGYKEYMILKGVHTYYNKSKVHMRIAQPSFGFKLGWSEGGKWKPATFTPNKFHIDEAYIFGSVKHNGKWQGIRMYID
nr:hypothetical protein [uncultured Draconibacterium sp.]